MPASNIRVTPSSCGTRIRCVTTHLLRVEKKLSATLFDYLPNCVVIIVFLGLGRERFLPLARYTHRSFLQVPAYLATLLPYLSPYLIPAGFLGVTVNSRLGLPSLRMVP